MSHVTLSHATHAQPLHEAAMCDRVDLVLQLLDAKANVDAQSSHGIFICTALHRLNTHTYTSCTHTYTHTHINVYVLLPISKNAGVYAGVCTPSLSLRLSLSLTHKHKDIRTH